MTTANIYAAFPDHIQQIFRENDREWAEKLKENARLEKVERLEEQRLRCSDSVPLTLADHRFRH